MVTNVIFCICEIQTQEKLAIRWNHGRGLFVVDGCSDLEVPFFWVTVKPHCHVYTADCQNNSNYVIPTERVQDVDSPFSVDPETGSLPPLATSTFSVTFAPSVVSKLSENFRRELFVSLIIHL